MKTYWWVIRLGLIVLLPLGLFGQTQVKIKPKGEFAKIAVSYSNGAIDSLKLNNSNIIAKVIATPQNYNPSVLYALATTLFGNDRKEEAAFWFYAGQLRARSDANKCLDKTARQAVSVLNANHGPDINKFAMSKLSFLKKTVADVIEWDKSTARNYDARWIALHGMDAFSKKEVRFEDQSEWEKINGKTREDYFNGFNKAVKSLEKRGKN